MTRKQKDFQSTKEECYHKARRQMPCWLICDWQFWRRLFIVLFFYMSFVFIFSGINKIYHARIRATKKTGAHKKAGNIYCLELASNERYANGIVWLSRWHLFNVFSIMRKCGPARRHTHEHTRTHTDTPTPIWYLWWWHQSKGNANFRLEPQQQSDPKQISIYLQE